LTVGGKVLGGNGFGVEFSMWVDYRCHVGVFGEDTASLVEAQGWHVNGDGAVVLSAQTPDGSPTPPQTTPVHCSPEQISR
jgi:hypothetical protein